MAINNDFFYKLDKTYEQLLASDDPKTMWTSVRKDFIPWPFQILSFCQPNIDADVFNELKNRAGKIGELLMLDFASRSDAESDVMADMEKLIDTTKQLVYYGEEKTKELAKGLLESMMVGIEALGSSSKPLRQQIIDCLCDIVDFNLGTTPKWRGYRRKMGLPDPKFLDILNGVLYSAVVNFHKSVKVGEIIKEHKELIESICCPVVSVGSRKGGTGKTLFIVALLTWIRNINKDARICIIDFDLSGPVWQYLLFPHHKSTTFLDDSFNVYQGNNEFKFPIEMEDRDIQNLVEQGECSFIKGGKIGHLGVHDIPSISRTLDIAIELNRGYFYPFLAKILSAISQNYDFIIMDNSPGFHSVPYCSLGISCSVEKGRAFIISTPSQPDLCGTFLELSEFCMTSIERAPLWIINKATEESKHFIGKDLTALQVAKKLRAYESNLPKCPLLEKILVPEKLNLDNIGLHYDISDYGFINSDGKPNLYDISGKGFYADALKILENTIPEEWILEKQ